MIDISDAQFSTLRKWNIGLTILHAAQAVLIFVLASDFAITFTSAAPEGPPGTRVPQGEGVSSTCESVRRLRFFSASPRSITC